MERPDRPDEDATAAERAEWMEEDFGWAVAEGMKNAGENSGHDVVEVEILNHESGEVVGTIDTDGTLETDREAVHAVSEQFLEEGVPVLVPASPKNETGETEHTDAEVLIEPGTEGFVRAFIDRLPSPYDCDLEILGELPVYDPERE